MLDTMLALTPLSGLHAAIKRRNSRARRDSISLGQSSSLTLPGNMRRFSSSESIAHKDGASVTRRSSFTRRIRRVSTATNQAEASENCAALDLHIERIKRKLAEFREEDVEISERVEQLTTSLTSLCHDYHIPVETTWNTAYLQHYHKGYSSQQTPESSSESESEEDSDEEEFQQYCAQHTHLMKTLQVPSILVEGVRYSTLPSRSNTPRSSRGASPYQDIRGRNSYPQDKNYHFVHVHYREKNAGRPLSYQEISYDENDLEENDFREEWSELSCP